MQSFKCMEKKNSEKCILLEEEKKIPLFIEWPSY